MKKSLLFVLIVVSVVVYIKSDVNKSVESVVNYHETYYYDKNLESEKFCSKTSTTDSYKTCIEKRENDIAIINDYYKYEISSFNKDIPYYTNDDVEVIVHIEAKETVVASVKDSNEPYEHLLVYPLKVIKVDKVWKIHYI